MESTHIIIFQDKTRKFITTKEYEYIFENSGGQTEMFELGASMYSFSDIYKMLDFEEYCKQYPLDSGFVYKKIDEERNGNQQIRNSKPRARELMLKGIKQYCDREGRDFETVCKNMNINLGIKI